MNEKNKRVNIPLIIITLVVICFFLVMGLKGLRIDTDIISALPKNDPVLANARHVMANHPIQDQLIIDIGCKNKDMDILVECSQWIEERLMASGLFKSVGLSSLEKTIPQIIGHILNNIPFLFSQKDLNTRVSHLLERKNIERKLQENISLLQNLEGVGQAELIARDPLGFRNIVLARLSGLAPSKKTKVYKGQLISSDAMHLLLVARPFESGTNTAFARKATKLFDTISKEMNEKYEKKGLSFTLTPMGAYRAALDNEILAKRDTQRAIFFATLGIAVLLVFTFPRPLIGLLAFVPAVVGTITALFVYSLLHESISLLTVGFGGAIISITVDHGIAYLLFLDRPFETSGKEAAREIRAVGLLATITTVFAFSSLSISGFDILSQIGQFAAFGIAFSFLFVHTIFPRIIPTMPPAKRSKPLFIQTLIDTLAMSGGRYKLFFCLALVIFMSIFAKPEFTADLRAMNTVKKETREAENLITSLWGNMFSRVHLMTEADSIVGLKKKGDKLFELMENDLANNTLSSAFIFTMLFPGEMKARQSLSAWKAFWNNSQVLKLKNRINTSASKIGFSTNAFEPFYSLIEQDDYKKSDIPEELYPFLGISKSKDDKKWLQYASLSPGSNYDAKHFYDRYTIKGAAKIFDPRYFSQRLGVLLSATFIKMFLIIGFCALAILFLFFRDWKLTLIASLPLAFAFVCTLGTLNLLGQPLGIPELMLSIVVMGMGIDYSIFFVRSYQRYNIEDHPLLSLIRRAVFLASISTIIGFGVLSMADHNLLKRAGFSSVLGIGYALMGTFFILPPLLKHVFDPSSSKGS